MDSGASTLQARRGRQRARLPQGGHLGGISPPLTFTANQPHKIDCWFTFHVANGVGSMANNGQTTCESASSS